MVPDERYDWLCEHYKVCFLSVVIMVIIVVGCWSGVGLVVAGNFFSKAVTAGQG